MIVDCRGTCQQFDEGFGQRGGSAPEEWDFSSQEGVDRADLAGNPPGLVRMDLTRFVRTDPPSPERECNDTCIH